MCCACNLWHSAAHKFCGGGTLNSPVENEQSRPDDPEGAANATYRTITYNSNDGRNLKTTQTVQEEELFTTASNKTFSRRYGYNYINGWNLNPNDDPIAPLFVTDYQSYYDWRENKTFYAAWGPLAYCVYFDPNGGMVYGSSETTYRYYNTEGWTSSVIDANWVVPSDRIITTLPSATKNGCTFMGWKATSKSTGNYDDMQEINWNNGAIYSSGTSVEGKYGGSTWGRGGLTFVAQWVPNSYKVTYDANNGFCDHTGNNFYTLGREYMYEDSITVNLWAYMDNWADFTDNSQRFISCTETGGWNIESQSSKVFFSCYDKGKGYKNVTTNLLWNSLASGWHMFTLTFDGKNARGYLDGALVGTSANYESKLIGYNAANTIFVGAEAAKSPTEPANSPCYFKGKTARVTIQNSCLDAESIAAEYSYYIGTTEQWKPVELIHDHAGNNYYTLGRNLMYEDSITVNLWAYMDNWAQAKGNFQRVISCVETGGWSIAENNGEILFGCYDKGTGYKNATTEGGICNNLVSGWHMFTLTFDGKNARGYIDGTLLATSAEYTSGKIGYNPTNAIFVGAEAASSATSPAASPYYFTGKTAGVDIQNKCFSSEEIAAIYAKRELNTQYVKYEESYGTLPTPERDGYKFDGWYLQNNLLNMNEFMDYMNEQEETTKSQESKSSYNSDYLIRRETDGSYTLRTEAGGWWNNGSWTSHRFKPSNIESGVTYKFSFYAKNDRTDGNMNTTIRPSPSYITPKTPVSKLNVTLNLWTYYECVFTVNDASNFYFYLPYDRNGRTYFKNVRLECISDFNNASKVDSLTISELGDHTLYAKWIEKTWEDYAADSFSGGDGKTAETAFIIKTPEQLAKLAKDSRSSSLNHYFKLGANIDLSAHLWEGISDSTFPFAGNLDGGNFTISGMRIMLGEGNDDVNGLFSATSGAKIKNLVMKYASISFDTTSSTQAWSTIGGLIGNSFNTNITNCKVDANINIPGGSMVGGLVGSSDMTTIMKGYFDGEITGLTLVGGIVGYAAGNTTITDCYNHGNITSISHYAGGIIGRGAYDNVNVNVDFCHNSGNISTSGNGDAGGIAGELSNTSLVSRCTSSGEVSGGFDVGGIMGKMMKSTVVIQDCISQCSIVATGSSITCGGIAGTGRGPISNCVFIGKLSHDTLGAICGNLTTGSYDSCYAVVGDQKIYTEGDFKGYYTDGDFDGFGVVTGLNEDFPVQKALFPIANYSPQCTAKWFSDRGFTKI